MANITLPYTLTNNTDADADEVMANLNAILAQVNGNLEAANLANGAITSAKILDGTIATGDLADGAVTSAKIADGTIAAGDLAAGVALSNLADGSVTSAKIADGTIATGDIADDAITAAKIGADQVGSSEIAADAVGSAEIAANAVGASEVGSLPGARVYNSVAISVPNASGTALTFDTERFDTDTMHDTGSNPSRLTATTAGVYIVTGHVEFAASATGNRQLILALNGIELCRQKVPAGDGASNDYVSIATIVKMAATDYVQLSALQSSGGALNAIATPNRSPEFAATWLGEG